MPDETPHGAPPSLETKKPRRRWPLRLARLGAGAAVLLVLGVVVLPLVLPDSWVGGIVAWQLRSNLGREAACEGASFSVFSGFRARGILIGRRPGFGDGPLARVGSLSATVDYPALLRGVVRIPEVAVEDVEAHLVRDEHGEFNVQDLLERPEPAIKPKLGRLAARNVKLFAHDLASGITQGIEVEEAEVGAPEDGARKLTAAVRLPQGGTVAADGVVRVTAGAEEFESAQIEVKLREVAIGQVAADALGKAAAPFALESILVSGDLKLGAAAAARKGSVDGTVTVAGLPPVSQLHFDHVDRVLEARVAAVISPDEQHIELALATRPEKGILLSLVIDPVKKGEPSFNLDNYALDLRLETAADLARGGIPGTPLLAGKGKAVATVKGTLARLAATLTASLDEAQVAMPDHKPAPLPPLALTASATAAPLDLAAELESLVLSAEGLKLTAAGKASPADGVATDGVQADPKALLPPLAVTGQGKADADFARWPQSLRRLVGMAADGQMSGTLAANASLALTTRPVRDERDLRRLVGKVEAKGGMALQQFAVASGGQAVPPSDLEAAFEAVVDVEKLAADFRNTSVRGSGIEGSLAGSISLAEGAEPSSLPGTLTVDLAEVARRYGPLVGLPQGLEVRGKLAAKAEALRKGSLVEAAGTATLTDLFIGGAAWDGEPVAEPKATFDYSLALDPAKWVVTVRKFALDSQRATATASGTLALASGKEESAFTAQATLDASLARFLPGLPPALRVRKASGRLAASLKASGTFTDLKVSGTVDAPDPGISLETPEIALSTKFSQSFEGSRAGNLFALKGTAKAADLQASARGLKPLVEKSADLAWDLELDWAKKLLRVKTLGLSSERAKATIVGSVPLAAGDERSSLDVAGSLDLSLLELVPGLPKPLQIRKASGVVAAKLQATGAFDDFQFTGSAASQGTLAVETEVAVATGLAASFTGARKGNVVALSGTATLTNFEGYSPLLAKPLADEKITIAHDLSADIAKGLLTVKRLEVTSKLASLKAAGTATLEKLDLALAGTGSGELLAFVPNLPPELKGLKASGTAAFDLKLAGSPAEPSLAGYLDAKDAFVSLTATLLGRPGVYFLKPPGTAARVDFDASVGKLLDVREAKLQLGDVRATARVKAPLDFSEILDARLVAPDVDLAALARSVPILQFYAPAGRVDVDLSATGKPKSPSVKGRILVVDCSAAITEQPDVRATAGGKIIADGSTVSVEDFRVALGKTHATVQVHAKGIETFPKTHVAVVADVPEADANELLAYFTPPAPPPGMTVQPGPAAPRPAVPGQAPKPEDQLTLPELPPELSGDLLLTVGKVTYDKRTMEKTTVIGKLAGSVLQLNPVAAQPMGGTLKAEARLEFTGDFRHAFTVKAEGVNVTEDFDVLSKIPILNTLLTSILAGKPDSVSCVAAANAQIATRGRDVDSIMNAIAGQGSVNLTNLQITGSPMFKVLAVYTQRPELVNIAFARVDAPFTVANRRIDYTATMPYEQGAFLVAGHATLDKAIDARVSVKDPTGISFFKGDLADYLADGNPLMIITGTVDAPSPQIPAASIAQFAVKNRLLKGLGKKDDQKTKKPEDDLKQKGVDAATDLLKGILGGGKKDK